MTREHDLDSSSSKLKTPGEICILGLDADAGSEGEAVKTICYDYNRRQARRRQGCNRLRLILANG